MNDIAGDGAINVPTTGICCRGFSTDSRSPKENLLGAAACGADGLVPAGESGDKGRMASVIVGFYQIVANEVARPVPYFHLAKSTG